MLSEPIPAIVDALRQALRAAAHPLADAPLQRLPDHGLAHDHVRLSGTGWLARMPKQSQLGLAATDNLNYQRACFERAAASGHTPRLLGHVPPSVHLPRGALLVEAIDGRPARLPQDLPALAQALAALHRLPLPARPAPLLHAADPLQALRDEVAAQATHLGGAALAPAARLLIERERAALDRLCSAPARPPRCLIAFDTHPGNFIVTPDGRAVLVDLEKCRYGPPGLDLAHATLYTSTTWDVATSAVLGTADELAFHHAWSRAVGPLADAAAPWHGPLRRAMWLWSVTWCAKWRAVSGRAAVADGEDWSHQRSDAALVRHVRERVDHYLDAATIAHVLDGIDALERALRA